MKLSELTNQAEARQGELPSNRSEDWRYVDVKRFAERVAGGNRDRAAPAVLSALPGIALGPTGRHCFGQLPASATWQDIGEDEVDPTWAKAVLAPDPQPAWTLGGQTHRLDLNRSTGPLLILHNGGHHRLHIRLARGQAADLIIVHQLDADEAACLGLDIELADGAQLRCDELEHLHASSQLLSHRRVTSGRDGLLRWRQLSRGARLVRHRWDIDLLAEGAEADIGAACQLRDQCQAHQHLRLRHAAANTSSQQRFRCVAEDQSRYSFDGLVRIDHSCPGAKAEQSANNLQLSPQARVFARPQLDINTDDVSANHGTSIGQADADELFYLRSRGIDRETANQLVIRGFLDEIVHDLHFAPLQDTASNCLADWLGAPS